MIDVECLNQFLVTGSSLFRKYTNATKHQYQIQDASQPRLSTSDSSFTYFNNEDYDPESNGITTSNDVLLNVIHHNSALRGLNAAQKRHLESLAEGPKHYPPGHFLWCVGGPVSYSYLIVSGTAKFANFSKRSGSARMRRGSTGSLVSLLNLYISQLLTNFITQFSIGCWFLQRGY